VEVSPRRKELRISRNKIEYIEYCFGGRDQEVIETKRPMAISGDTIGEVKRFKYLRKEYLY